MSDVIRRIACFPVMPAELTLGVHGRNLSGHEVRVALYASAHGFPNKDDEARIAKSTVPDNKFITNSVSIRFSNLPSGEYAVAVFADSNGNGKLDRNFCGIPTEPYGFSRVARGLMGPPDFAKAAFRFGDADVSQTFHLQ